MSEQTGIVIDTPGGINMWVLLSRRAQIKMHLAGYPVRGLASCLKREFPGQGRYVKDFIVPVEFAISEAGGEVDYSRVNVHLMHRTEDAVFGEVLVDMGIYANMDDAGTPENRSLFHSGELEVVLTTEDVRDPNGHLFRTS